MNLHVEAAAGPKVPACVRGLRQIDLVAIGELLLQGANDANLLGVGSRRPSKKNSEPHPYAHFPVPIRDWRQLLPKVLADLRPATTYLNFATFDSKSCPISRKNKPIRWWGEEVWYSAKNDDAREMLSVVIDLDIGRDDLPSADEAEPIILRLADDGIVPTPNLIVRSGRGLHLHYLLSDGSKPRRPPPKTPENVGKRRHVLDLLFRALASFAPDSQSYNVVQFFKAPGTLDGRVVYRLVDTAEGRSYWTLNELLEFPGLRQFALPEQTKTPGSRRVTTRSRPRSSAQRVAPMKHRLIELWRIANERGIRIGMRNHAMMCFVTAQREVLRAQYSDPQEIERFLRDLASRFNNLLKPPLNPGEFESKLRSRQPTKPHRNETVARHLKITRAEAERLNLTSILPPDLAWELEQAKAARRLAKAERRAQCDAMIFDHVPYSQIAKLLGMPPSTVRSRAAKLRKTYL